MEESEVIQLIRKELEGQKVDFLHQSQISPAIIKERHLDLGKRANGDILYLDTEKRLKNLNAGTAGRVLRTGGTTAAPSWTTRRASRWPRCMAASPTPRWRS